MFEAIIVSLLCILCLLGIAIHREAKGIRKELYLLRDAFTFAVDTNVSRWTDHAEKLSETAQDAVDRIRTIESSIRDIQFVTDTIYKYKLPNNDEQRFLDKIEVDNGPA